MKNDSCTMILIDLFCGAGGASVGYDRLGMFDRIVGVDLAPQKRYPYEFVQADWESGLSILPGLLERNGDRYWIHASPPCQRYSTMTKKWGRSDTHPDLVERVREALIFAQPDAWIIENVPSAPLRDPVMLCGSMFNLGADGYQLRRHRIFETSIPIVSELTCAHDGRPALPVYGHAGGSSRRDGLKFPGVDAWRAGMDLPYMVGRELAEAIPPAFTHWIGARLLEALREARQQGGNE